MYQMQMNLMDIIELLINKAKQTIVLQFKSNETLLNDITNSLTKLQILMYEDTGEVDDAGVVTVSATPANSIKYNVDTIKINYKS